MQPDPFSHIDPRVPGFDATDGLLAEATAREAGCTITTEPGRFPIRPDRDAVYFTDPAGYADGTPHRIR